MISKHLKRFSVPCALGVAFLAAASAAVPALWADNSPGADIENPLSLTDSFICSADFRNVARMPEYMAIMETLKAYRDNLHHRFLDVGSQKALRTMIEAQHPDRLEEEPDTGALIARWGRVNPQKPDRIIMDRVGAPAYLRIDLAAGSYTEMWMRDGAFSPQGGPSYTEITKDGITRQWLVDEDYDNPEGPAMLTLSDAEQTLDLLWYKGGLPAFIDGHPSRIKMDTATGIVFHEEYAAGGGHEKRQTHRPSDHLNVLNRDRQTGVTIYAYHMYHDSDPRSDEITREVIFDPKTGVLQSDVWEKNGLTIARPSIIPFITPEPGVN